MGYEARTRTYPDDTGHDYWDRASYHLVRMNDRQRGDSNAGLGGTVAELARYQSGAATGAYMHTLPPCLCAQL
jgi:hypothetical protein